MKAIIAITPLDNIGDGKIINPNQVITKEYDANLDEFTFRDTVTDRLRRDTLSHVSLFDDVLIERGVEYKILNMLTKPK